MPCSKQFRGPLALSLMMGITSGAVAIPYAANVRNTGGNTWEFVVNEDADVVTVLRDGGNPVVLSTSAGRKTFDMTSFTDFEIQVSKNTPVGWTAISDANNLFTNFTIPSGLAINADPSSLDYFGTVYVASASATATASGRSMGDGIYALTADMIGVDLANNFAAVADPNDTTQAKHPGFDVAGSTSTSPWRLSFDDSNNLIVSDWSDPSGGVKYASRDLTSGGLILGGTDSSGTPIADGSGTGPGGGIYSQEMDEFGRIPLHGSSAGKAYVTGTVGVDLTLWTMDEDLDVDLSVPNNDTNSVWRYDVGGATNYDALAPELVIGSTSIPTTTDGRSNFIGAFGPGVRAGMHYDPTFDKWYLIEPRSAGNESSVTIISANPDGSDALAPTVEWSSLQFTIDNGLDADAVAAGLQDVFRRVGDVTISPDKKFIVFHRSSSDAAHAGLGTEALFVVPLDANGIPMITVSEGAITNVQAIPTIGSGGAHSSGNQVEFDAAGNLYVANSSVTTNNIGQLVQVFSPGGSFTAITGSDGTFSLEAFEPPTLLGDYNGDGSVNAADYTVWRDGGSPDDTQAGYDLWAAHFGETAGSGSGAAVPEPAGWNLLALGAIVSVLIRGRRMFKNRVVLCIVGDASGSRGLI